LRGSGRRIVLVTGRELDDLLPLLPEPKLFDRIVAENGALLQRPESGETKVLGAAPDERFVEALRVRRIAPLSVGRVIVATWEPHEATVLETIRELGLELHVVFNKGAVMVLPPGVSKASGLVEALRDLGLSPRNAVGVGDAENDHAFLRACECRVAVANALPSVREEADWVTPGENGAGVRELVEALLEDDLRAVEPRLVRHHVPLGECEDGRPRMLPPYGISLFVAGTSGSGKSTFATGILERLAEGGAQLCVIDPEGDYPDLLEDALTLGSAERAPTIEEVSALLESPQANVVVNLLGVDLEERPRFFERLLARLLELRARTGRPHWILVDETHLLLPRERAPSAQLLPETLHGMIWITVHPDHVSPAILTSAREVVVIGKRPAHTLRTIARSLGVPAPQVPPADLEPGHGIAWQPGSEEPPCLFRAIPPRAERRRHQRKYTEGELGEDRSFFFRGPAQRLKLRASNLMQFLELAEGVDDETWMHHLGRGDYSSWFRGSIKDEGLAAEAARIEREALPPAESRARIRRAVLERYTAPA
jgi:HAD superfamily hydrolase (TIGR01484 family)